MGNKPLLKDILGNLVWRGKRDHVELSNGLIVAYTPPELNDGRHRFCLSRKGEAVPSEFEARTTWAHFAKSGRLGRNWLRHVYEQDEAGNWVIEWGVAVQRPLFESGSRRLL